MGDAETAKSAPVPDRVTVCGVSMAESEITRAADSGPETVGEKVTEMVHLAEGARLEPQVVVSAKSVEPAMLMELMVRVDLAVF